MICMLGRVLVLLAVVWALPGTAADCGKELPPGQLPFLVGCAGKATCLPTDAIEVRPGPDAHGPDGKALSLSAICGRLRGSAGSIDADLQVGAPPPAPVWQYPLGPLIDRWLTEPAKRELMTSTERGVLKLDLFLTDSAGRQWLVPLNVELGLLWHPATAGSAFGLRVTQVSCAPCKVGGMITLTVPELRIWRELGPGDPSKLQLVIDGVRLPALTPRDQIPGVAGVAGVAGTPGAGAPPPAVPPRLAAGRDAAAPVIAFTLDHQSGRAEMQAAWATILAEIAEDPQHRFDVGLADDRSVLAAAIERPQLEMPASRPIGGIAAFVAVALVVYVFGRRTRWRFVRDEYEIPDNLVAPEHMPFSLARCQMLVWTACFAMAWFAIWIFTGDAIVVDATAVALIGVSAGTGLGATAVGQPPAYTRWVTAYLAEKSALQESPAAAMVGADVPEGGAVASRAGRPATPAREALIRAASSDGLWRDLLTDYGTDSSDLHRMQNVVFTLVFATYVLIYATLHGVLPVLSEWQLALMGISGGTYVGWKVFAK
jgi:hypothetical protein